MSRLDYANSNAKFFVEMCQHSLSIDELEAFANSAEQVAHERSREITDHIKDKNDESWLTDHANLIRSLIGKIILLRGGFVPALRIDKHSPTLRYQAVHLMGYIRADFEAMRCFMR